MILYWRDFDGRSERDSEDLCARRERNYCCTSGKELVKRIRGSVVDMCATGADDDARASKQYFQAEDRLRESVCTL